MIGILSYHVIESVLPSFAIKTGALTTLQGSDVDVFVSQGGVVTINADSRVQEFDVLASNGIVHVVDTVLIPTDTAEPTDAPTDVPSTMPSSASMVTGLFAISLAAIFSGVL